MAKNLEREGTYWNKFYGKKENRIPSTPSQFATFAAATFGEDRNISIVEFGCGNARDAHFFAHEGFDVIATDKSSEAIKQNGADFPLCNLTFMVADVKKESEITQAVSAARVNHPQGGVVVYSRFFLHTLNRVEEAVFVKALADVMLKGEKICFEFRCAEDAQEKKVFGNHYRRFVDSDMLVKTLESLGYRIDMHEKSKNFAPYKDERPWVSRIIATKS